jgi:hypothetical protein
MYRAVIYCTTVGMASTALFSMPRPALAAVILQKSAGTPLPQGNLVQYTFSAAGTSGETIATFTNPSITPLGGGLGIHNVRQGFTNAATPTKGEHNPALWNEDWTAYDTYFLFDQVQTLSIGPPFSETNDDSTSGTLGLSTIPTNPMPTKPTSGFGTYNSDPDSRKALLTQWQGSNTPFMQVVLRAQDSARLRVLVAPPDTGVPQSVEREIVIGPLVPEPSAAALFAISSLGLVVSRRIARDR